MKLKSAILLLLIVFYFSSCKPPTSKQEQQINYPAYSPTPKPTAKRVYKEPEIGMDGEDFNTLCSRKYTEITSRDDTDIYESARGTTVRIRREYTTKRSKNGCWGTFTFFNNKLESIYYD